MVRESRENGGAAAKRAVRTASDSHTVTKPAVRPSIIYIDGKLLPESEAKISVFEHGLLYGDGIFEGIRFYNGRVFRMEEHMERHWDSARSICLDISMPRPERD